NGFFVHINVGVKKNNLENNLVVKVGIWDLFEFRCSDECLLFVVESSFVGIQPLSEQMDSCK
ncbi:2598_t:CDS:2, partial [Cetraspora pellucida]